MSKNQKQASLIGMLFCLTIIFVAAQIAFFFIHYHVGNIVDSLASISIMQQLFHPVILLPILGFIFIQLLAYGLFVVWIWFVAVSFGELFNFSRRRIYQLGIFFWLLGLVMIFSLNAHYFPHSFFAASIHEYKCLNQMSLAVGGIVLLMVTMLAFIHCFMFKRHQIIGAVLILIVLAGGASNFDDRIAVSRKKGPNIILIGLDSMRPDYTGYFGNLSIRTPNIDHFLQSATVFTNAYTPLARTFPSWISILTAKYPLHHHARMNLVDSSQMVVNETLATRLKASGYFTIYGTDETRFTDITKFYGFDRLIGPKGGAVEFLLGGLSDFPLTNLLINLPAGRFLFPYNYGNRAADVTYEPDKFLRLVKVALTNRPNKPVFLAIHLCLTHWPFRWAQDGQPDDLSMQGRYESSVAAVDVQLGNLMQILKQTGLLDHSMVVLLSDHGVTLGMRGDRIISEKNYRGDPKKMKSVNAVKLSSAPDFTLDFKHDYSISASYGQGTDVLSLKQHHVLMAFKGFGITLPVKHIDEFSSLLDIAPTILDYLHLVPLSQADGVPVTQLKPQAFFIETGDKVAETENNNVVIEKVIKRTIGAYRIANNGLLILTPAAEKSIIANKQHAIIWKDWLLARYPVEMRYKIASTFPLQKKPTMLTPTKMPPYFVLVNLKTGQWTVGLSSPFAKNAPIFELMQQFKAFYGEEV